MLKNYIKIAFRNLLRHKVFSFLNIAGLAIGMACSILIFLWVQDELNFDRFHENAESLYRITADATTIQVATTPAALAVALKAELPEVKNAGRLSMRIESLFEVGNIKFKEKNGFFADSSLLQMFSFPLIKGNAKTALSSPDGIIISEKLAKKYFAHKDALGKTIKLNNKDFFIVKGILKNIPTNAHLQFDYLIPLSFAAKTNDNLKSNSWGNFTFYSYVHLDEGFTTTPSNISLLNEKINGIFKKNDLRTNIDFNLQPVTAIHLHSKFMADVGGHGEIQYVRILSIVAIFILFIACINFMNLATARSGHRAREVGLRKVIGASRRNLIGQFMGESLLLSFLAFFLAITLVFSFLPIFNRLSGKALLLDFSNEYLFIGFLLIATFAGIFSGSYPALFLSSLQPVIVLKGESKIKKSNFNFRNGLVIAQFVISIILIIGTTIVYSQLQFIKSKNLGFEKENLLYVPLSDKEETYKTFKAELEQNHLTSNFSITSDLPTNLVSGSADIDWEGKDPNSQHIFSNFAVDETFVEVFKIKMVSGRGFSKDIKADTTNFLLNEKAVREMGMDTASVIGKAFGAGNRKGKIVGVVKDFNYKPVHQSIEPMFLSYNRDDGIVVIKTQPGKTEATISALKNIWQRTNPAYPFTYNFVDKDLENLYQTEQRMGSLFNAFAVLAIFISCLGLYGLAAFTAEQRTKEIGIRKTLGASVANITGLLSRNFLKLVLIAIALATPLSWFIMSRWLEGFAYKVDLGIEVFIIASCAALLIAGLTVSYESIKAALANPVKSLKSE